MAYRRWKDSMKVLTIEQPKDGLFDKSKGAIMNFKIDDKQIEIFCNETENKKIPVIILNTYSSEGNKVWEECTNLYTKDFILVAISKLDWNDDITPWECPPLYKGDDYYKRVCR